MSQPDPARRRGIRTQQLAVGAFVAVAIIGAVVRAQGNSVGTTLLEIAAALLIVAVILFVFSRSLGGNSDTLTELRRTEPVAYACYLENGKRGIISAVDGELVLRRFKGRSLHEIARLAPGTWALTPARQADGVTIAPPGSADGSGVRVALGQDRMTLTGGTLTGPALDEAATRLAIEGR